MAKEPKPDVKIRDGGYEDLTDYYSSVGDSPSDYLPPSFSASNGGTVGRVAILVVLIGLALLAAILLIG
jgi:hypothetical protein